MAGLREGRLPVFRALTPTADERLIRELVLQFKLGRVSRGYFAEKFGVDLAERFAEPLAPLERGRVPAARRRLAAADPRRVAAGGPAAARVLPAGTPPGALCLRSVNSGLRWQGDAPLRPGGRSTSLRLIRRLRTPMMQQDSISRDLEGPRIHAHPAPPWAALLEPFYRRWA